MRRPAKPVLSLAHGRRRFRVLMAVFFQSVCAAAKIRPNDPDEDLAFAVKADLSTRRSPAVSASAQPTFAGTRCLPIEDYFHRIPLVPWICPPLHPELLRLLENIGQESRRARRADLPRGRTREPGLPAKSSRRASSRASSAPTAQSPTIRSASRGPATSPRATSTSSRTVPQSAPTRPSCPPPSSGASTGSSSKSPDAIPISSCCSPLSANSQCSPTALPSPVSRS